MWLAAETPTSYNVGKRQVARPKPLRYNGDLFLFSSLSSSSFNFTFISTITRYFQILIALLSKRRNFIITTTWSVLLAPLTEFQIEANANEVAGTRALAPDSRGQIGMPEVGILGWPGVLAAPQRISRSKVSLSKLPTPPVHRNLPANRTIPGRWRPIGLPTLIVYRSSIQFKFVAHPFSQSGNSD